MPYYSHLKNIHRADYDIRQEQLDWEQNDEDYRKEIYDMIKHYDSVDDCGDRTFWYDSVYEALKVRDYSGFDDSWVDHKFDFRNTYPSRVWCWRCLNYGCKCSFRFCSCDLCYEVCTTSGYEAHTLVKKYFSAEEIYNTHEVIVGKHLAEEKQRQSLNTCWCSRVEVHINPFEKKEFLRHVLSRKEGIEPFEPQEIDMGPISRCAIWYLQEIIRQKAKELHDAKELREKAEILAKYGLTLEDHEEMKRKWKEEKETSKE